MKLVASLGRHLRWRPIPSGEPAPELSLTADEGTWVKLPDLRGRFHVLLVFFRSMLDDETDAFLRRLQKDRTRFEALDTVIFAVSQRRTEALREYRSRLGLEFYLLYDPLALTARSFGCSGRVRLYCKPSTVLVGKDGSILRAERGYADVEALLRQLADLEGKDVPGHAEARTFDGIREPGAPAALARGWRSDEASQKIRDSEIPFVLVDVRTPEEHGAWHPAGSLNIPLDEMPHRYPEIPQTTHILCVDANGGLGQAAAEFLTSVGRSEVYYLSDGLEAWRCADAP